MCQFFHTRLCRLQKKSCCHLRGDRPGSEMPACSRLLPQIIPPANGEVEFQISGPQVHGSFEMKLCQIYGFGVRTEETVAILSEFCLELSDLNRRLHFEIRAQKLFVARVCSLKNMRTSVKRSRHRARLQEARLPSPACKCSYHRRIYSSYKARESPHAIPSPNCFLLKQKRITADCTPFTLDAVKDFAGCYTKTSHAVFTELNIIFFFFLP